jgi:hypothetical protein
MARRKAYEKIDINVEPFLSIMAIVLKLISLILVVIIMRIALNPHALKIIALAGIFQGRGNIENPKIPSYIDCYPDGLVLYPLGTRVSWEDLQRPGNAVEQLLEKVQENTAKEYVVVMVRPQSVKYYRTVRNLIGKRPIDVGYDAVDADFKVDWDEARKALSVSE